MSLPSWSSLSFIRVVPSSGFLPQHGGALQNYATATSAASSAREPGSMRSQGQRRHSACVLDEGAFAFAASVEVATLYAVIQSAFVARPAKHWSDDCMHRSRINGL